MIQDYGFRLYNPAIGKFLSVDPLAPSYPWYTPYQFAGNKPVRFIDLDGLEEFDPMSDQEMALGSSALLAKGVEGFMNTALSIGEGLVLNTSEASAIRNAAKNNNFYIPEEFTADEVVKHYKMRYVMGQGFIAEDRGSVLQEAGKGAGDVLDMLPFTPGSGQVATFARGFVSASVLRELSTESIENLLSKVKASGAVVADDAETIKYLNHIGAEAAFMDDEFGGALLLRPGAEEPEIIEEVLHYRQRQTMTSQEFLAHRNQIEIDTQDQLLDIGKQRNWSTEQMDRIREAKQFWVDLQNKRW